MIYQIRDSSVFIIGTIHLVPNGAVLSLGQEQSIVDRADEIIFESDLENPPAPDCHLLESRGLLNILGKSLYDLVVCLATKARYEEPFDQFKPWFLGLVLTIRLQLSSGATLDGLDRKLWGYAKSMGKPVYVLEGGEIFQAIDAAPLAESVAALEFLAEHPDEPVSQLDAIYQAWRNSDLIALDTAIVRMARLMPTIYHYLFQERNRLWMQSLFNALHHGRRAAFVVGCGHIAHGDGSIRKLLEAGGYSLDPIK